MVLCRVSPTITPRASASRNHYNGYVSATTWDMAGAASRVEVPRKAAGGTNTIFSVGIDSNNWYRLRALGGSLYLEKKVSGSSSGTSPTARASENMKDWIMGRSRNTLTAKIAGTRRAVIRSNR